MKITLTQGLGLGGVLLTGLSGVLDTLGEDNVKTAVKEAFTPKPKKVITEAKPNKS